MGEDVRVLLMARRLLVDELGRAHINVDGVPVGAARRDAKSIYATEVFASVGV